VILDNSAKDILPKVYGTDFGVTLKPVKKLLLKTALWHLYSEQEFVYVGDAGIVEPGGKTRRMGVDISARYQFTNWLFGDLDLNYTKARVIGAVKGENYIPLAPAFTSIGGLSVKMKNGFSGSLRYRFMDDRPANEMNTVRAQGYFIADMVLGYAFKKFEFNISVENIFNREWREAQFDTESRLQFEPASVSEIHYTPGTPRFIKAAISFKF
jgi:outer membrane receptor protein involved in Fe transport